jgi:hypothetical protein
LTTVEVADLLLEDAEAVQDHQLRRLSPGFDVEVLAQLADVVVLAVLAPRTLPRGEHQVAGANRVHEVGDRRTRYRHLVTQRRQTFLNL